MFAEDSYWRDLVSFTWNIKTAEGKENIKAMLEATLPHVKPSKWQIEGEVTEDGGVVIPSVLHLPFSVIIHATRFHYSLAPASPR